MDANEERGEVMTKALAVREAKARTAILAALEHAEGPLTMEQLHRLPDCSGLKQVAFRLFVYRLSHSGQIRNDAAKGHAGLYVTAGPKGNGEAGRGKTLALAPQPGFLQRLAHIEHMLEQLSRAFGVKGR